MKNNYFILVLFSLMMSTLLVSCDDKEMDDPFAGIEVQKGAKEFPYSTNEFVKLAQMTTDRLHALNLTETKHWRDIWFQGYIVGCYDAASENPVQLTAPYTTNSTLLIAQTADETDLTNMVLVTVNVPYWQSQLGLEATNGGSKNRLVKFYGDVVSPDLQTDPSLVEMANMEAFWWVAENTGLVVNSNPYFSENFTASIGSTSSNFHDRHVASSKATWKSVTASQLALGTTTSTYGPDSLSEPPAADESWLVSVAIEIPVCDYATLSFKAKPSYWSTLNAADTFDPSQELTFYVAELADGEVFLDPLIDVSRFTKVELTGYPTGAAETVIVKDLTSYVGKKIQIAFKYNSLVWYKFGGKIYPQAWNISNIEIK